MKTSGVIPRCFLFFHARGHYWIPIVVLTVGQIKTILLINNKIGICVSWKAKDCSLSFYIYYNRLKQFTITVDHSSPPAENSHDCNYCCNNTYRVLQYFTYCYDFFYFSFPFLVGYYC